jgi:hypothetical protein
MTTIATELAAALDPVIFGQRIKRKLDPWQTEVLRSSHPRLLLNCARQTGKSTVAALLALYTAFYQSRSTTLIISPTQRQSQELFRKVLAGYRYLGRPITPQAENQMSLALDNGARVISLPGNESTVRGYSAPNLIIIDEAAQVPDDIYQSVRPMLVVSGGRLVALSTPYGVSGWWASAWQSETAEAVHERWQRYRITASQCPRIDPATLAEERLALGEWAYRQEYECEFMDDRFAVFREEDIQALANSDIEEWKL